MSNRDQRLQSLTDRLLRLHEERDALGSDIRDIYAEAKSAGYDVPALRLVIKRMRENADERAKRENAETLRDVMLVALGQLADTPLGKAATA